MTTGLREAVCLSWGIRLKLTGWPASAQPRRTPYLNYAASTKKPSARLASAQAPLTLFSTSTSRRSPADPRRGDVSTASTPASLARTNAYGQPRLAWRGRWQPTWKLERPRWRLARSCQRPSASSLRTALGQSSRAAPLKCRPAHACEPRQRAGGSPRHGIFRLFCGRRPGRTPKETRLLRGPSSISEPSCHDALCNRDDF